MPNTIRIKRSDNTDVPSSLAKGEPAYSFHSGKLFVGDANNDPVTIGGYAYVQKLNGIEAGANNYTHPSTHPASMITTDSNHKFVTQTQIDTWNAKASTSVATQSANGLMSSTDKHKLDDIEAEANKYIHPTTSGNKHIPSGGNNGEVLINNGDGVAVWGALSTGVTSVAGKTGDVTLSKSDVGLGNVDNTADSAKTVAKANKFTTARTIAGVSFDGGSNIDIPLANLLTDSTHRAMTDDEKNKIITLYNWYQIQVGDDADDDINTLKDVLDMVAGMPEGYDLLQQLTNPTNMTLDGGEF